MSLYIRKKSHSVSSGQWWTTLFLLHGYLTPKTVVTSVLVILGSGTSRSVQLKGINAHSNRMNARQCEAVKTMWRMRSNACSTLLLVRRERQINYYNRVGWMHSIELNKFSPTTKNSQRKCSPFPDISKAFLACPFPVMFLNMLSLWARRQDTVQRRVNMAQVGRIRALRDAGRIDS